MPPETIQMVGLYVRDFDAALRFYRDIVGISLEVDAHGDYHHADYSFHDPYFHFAILPALANQATGATHLSIRVTDCQSTFQRAVEDGATAKREPEQVNYSGGGWSAEVLDPDGNEVEFFQADSTDPQPDLTRPRPSGN